MSEERKMGEKEKILGNDLSFLPLDDDLKEEPKIKKIKKKYEWPISTQKNAQHH